MAQAIKNQEVEYYGPYGSKSKETYRMQLRDGEQFREIIVRHESIVDALGFVIARPDGTTFTYQFGGNGGIESKIGLKIGEYVTGVSGISGYYLMILGDVIGEIKIHTNLNPNGYGPFGNRNKVLSQVKFSSPVISDGRAIVGFFGRSGWYLESIGVMIPKMPEIQVYGPYGSQLPENFRVPLEYGDRFKEVIVKYGSIVDSLGFVITKKNGTTVPYQFGGNGFYEGKVTLKDGEYLTRISGIFGNASKYLPNNGVVIGTMTIHTNLNPNGYGPFGKGIDMQNVKDYSSPTMTDGPIIGFLGRSGKFLESAGVMIRKEFP